MGARVRDDERRVGERGHVPEAALVQVGEVEHDPEPVAGPDELPARRGEPRARVGRGGDAERDALAERVRAAPDEPERAKTALVERLEPAEVRVERLGALEMEDRSDPVALDTCRELGGGAHDAHGAARRGLDREQQLDLRFGEALCVVRVERRERRDLPAAGPIDDELLESRVARDVDGEEAAREAARARPRQVEVLGDAAVEEPLGPGAGAPEREQRIVVPVEDPDRQRVSSETLSTCGVCGNMSTGVTCRACSRTRRAAP